MDFTNKPMKWDNAGVQPSAELSAKGYVAKDKPAADTFNYFLHNFYKCVEEMQNSLKRIGIEDGGTGATNRKEAFYSLGFLGIEPIDSPDEDTPANWSALGTGYAWYGSNDRLKDQPTSYAIVLNLTYGTDIMQFWIAQPIGRVYKRSGSSVGWDGTWFKSYDEKNKPTPADIGALPTSGGTVGDLTVSASNLKPLKAVNSVDNSCYTHYSGKSGALGFLGFSGANIPAFVTADGSQTKKLYGEHNKPTASDVGLGVVDISSDFISTEMNGYTVSFKKVYKQGNVINGLVTITGDFSNGGESLFPTIKINTKYKPKITYVTMGVMEVVDETVVSDSITKAYIISSGSLCYIAALGSKFNNSSLQMSFTYICE